MCLQVCVCCEQWGREESMTSLLQGIYRSHLSCVAAVIHISNKNLPNNEQ